MDMKDPFDVSSYMLLEVTGDSEADCNPIMGEQAHEIDREDDDAQSCSDDNSETCNASELNVFDESLNADDEDEKKVDGYGTSYCEDDEMQEHHKSCVSDDSGQELVDEMERNRLFWEACLAS
ncbi:uncharacterized protein LOC133309701 [Gastrolobium bilobum]|uniref:uncharacterized protein LOC133309701 n=1 Tax=Gastrolobium bilobum TaxID=150636 RepID=UPI002AB0414B|nr:uncharacterized protein LOC133309701 [Gastrolobium bilobum]